MSKKKYTLEDLKQAFKAGGSVISWSDWGVSMEYESFDDWFRMSYKKKKDE